MPATSPAVSEARQAANARNALHSTGPRSPEGKARAAANSRTHNLCSKDVVIATPEEQIEFDDLLELHLIEVNPSGSVEQVIFDEMIAASWNLRRIRRLDAALQQGLDPLAALDDDKLQTKLDRLAVTNASKLSQASNLDSVPETDLVVGRNCKLVQN